MLEITEKIKIIKRIIGEEIFSELGNGWIIKSTDDGEIGGIVEISFFKFINELYAEVVNEDGDFKYNNVNVKVLKGILIDKMVNMVDVEDFEGSSNDLKAMGGYMELSKNKQGTMLKSNVGKLGNNGFNIGATPCEVRGELAVLESIAINIKGVYSVEYCINVLVDFEPCMDNKLWLSVFNMFTKNKFKTSTITVKNDKILDNYYDVIKNNTYGIKGYKTGMTLKLYDKFFEKAQKGKLEDMDGKNLLRLELGLNKAGLRIYGVEDIEKDLYKIENIFKKIIKDIREFSGANKKVTRWNKNISKMCDKMIENI